MGLGVVDIRFEGVRGGVLGVRGQAPFELRVQCRFDVRSCEGESVMVWCRGARLVEGGSAWWRLDLDGASVCPLGDS